MEIFRVVPEGGWWILLKDGENLGLFSDRERAKAVARSMASACEQASVVVLDRNGTELEGE